MVLSPVDDLSVMGHMHDAQVGFGANLSLMGQQVGNQVGSASSPPLSMGERLFAIMPV